VSWEPRPQSRWRCFGLLEKNARLTGTTASVLLFLLAAEGLTVFRVRSLLTAQVFIGALIIPPILLKMASTGWRFARYYLGDPGYRQNGPPRLYQRLLGPAVVTLSVVLFGSGVVLLFSSGGLRSNLMFVHKASFILWFGAMTLHVLGHLGDTARLTIRDWTGSSSRRLGGRGIRAGLQVAGLVAGALLGLGLVGRLDGYLAATPHFLR
jgi:hypothetical protein